MTSPEIKRILRQALKWCKANGASGKSFVLDKYYVKFSFRPRKEICNQCGRELNKIGGGSNV